MKTASQIVVHVVVRVVETITAALILIIMMASMELLAHAEQQPTLDSAATQETTGQETTTMPAPAQA